MTAAQILADLDHLAATLAVSPERAAVELGRLRGGLQAQVENERRRLVRYFEREIERRPSSAMVASYRAMITRFSAEPAPQSAR